MSEVEIINRVDPKTPHIEMKVQRLIDIAQNQLMVLSTNITKDMMINAYRAGYAAAQEDAKKAAKDAADV
jgi:hypothetical protein